MKFENETQLIFKGDVNQTLWGYQNPPFDGEALNVTLDAAVMPESRVPFRYVDGKDFWMMGRGNGIACMTYVFKLGGAYTREHLDDQLRLIGKFTHALPHDWTKYHTSQRAFPGSEKGSIRTFVYRVHRNMEGMCQGHPEMLCGAAIGMHHCNVCGEMVMAGIPHASNADIKRAEEELMQLSMQQQAAEKEDWFQKVWAKVEAEYVAYGKLEEGWYDDLPPPLPESLKLAREFLSYLRENLAVHRRNWFMPSLDHEGYVGIYSPNHEVSKEGFVLNDSSANTWWSCAFYPDETVVYEHDRTTDKSETVKIPQGPEHNAQLLAIIHKL